VWKFEWNALRPGDHVAVHDDNDRRLGLDEGVVELVETRVGGNDVAVRLDGSTVLVRPRRVAVHLWPIDPQEACWRCEAAAVAQRDTA
jgi:hypothetical protein